MRNQNRILIMGLPGAGKTTLARILVPKIGAVWFDADEVRPKLWPELDYSYDNRIENSKRMGWVCSMAEASGYITVASFVCPTPATRLAFSATYTIWIDRIKEGRFADTNQMFIPPEHYDLRLSTGSPNEWLAICLSKMELN